MQLSALDTIKNSIKDPGLQDKAIDLFNQHVHDLGIYDSGHMSPSEALALRQALRNDANFNSIQPNIGTKLYRAVSGALHDGVPELVPVDTHFGDLTTAMQALQKQTSNYLLGKWTPPQTRIQKAEAEIPARADFTNPALLKLGIGIGAAAGLGTGLVKLGGNALNNSTAP